MIKLLAHSPARMDATSWYRAYGVFPSLNVLLDRELLIVNYMGGTWADIYQYDILFLQRPMTRDVLKLAGYAKSLGLKIWIDMDDNLLQLPPESRAFFDFPADTRQCMISMYQIADVVTVSTMALAVVLEQFGAKRVVVIPNALNDQVHRMSTVHNVASKDVVWRGSETHVADLLYLQGAIEDAISKSDDVYHFMGYAPWSIAHKMDYFAKGIYGEAGARIHFHKPEDNKIYHENIQALAPRLMHVPLVVNELNVSKSNIAWIEATFAGAACIAPDWPEWRMPGVLLYKTEEEYTQLLISQDDRTENWRKSRDYIKENLLLSVVNKQRVALVAELMGFQEPKMLTMSYEPD